ncbi:hypothetical protein NMY22_g16770 [Coprinellus aureogranulatus]|nr:hypothetical protein NMY22_g16770 [Coprinellus aureogranulatus]
MSPLPLEQGAPAIDGLAINILCDGILICIASATPFVKKSDASMALRLTEAEAPLCLWFTFMARVKRISDASKNRAERAAPNGRRCLVSGRDTAEIAYAMPRELSRDLSLMRCLEWSWNMREGTLNLDTRQNVFFLAPGLHSLYKEKKWILLPEGHIIERFFSKPVPPYSGDPISRQGFPVLEDETFRYTFFPLDDLSDIVISRISGDGSEERPILHTHPFKSLPTLKSHLHPKFVLMGATYSITQRELEPYVENLIKTDKIIREVSSLIIAWQSDDTYISLRGAKHPSFCAPSSPPHSGEANDCSGSKRAGDVSLESDSVRTIPRRVGYPPSQCINPYPVPQASTGSHESWYAWDASWIHAGDLSEPPKKRGRFDSSEEKSYRAAQPTTV